MESLAVNNHELNLKFQKADLIWEATRRNEQYKQYYKKMLAKKYDPVSSILLFEENPDIAKIKIMQAYSSNKDAIKNIFFGEHARWKMLYRVFNPNITICDIRNKMAGGENPYTIHPYFWMHPYKFSSINDHAFAIPNSVNELDKIEIIDINKKPEDYTKETLRKNEALRKRMESTEEKFLIEIDSNANNQTIFDEIKKLKSKVSSDYKADLYREKEKGCFSICSLKEIDTAIEYLEVYDYMVDEIKKYCNSNGESLKITSGFIEKPKGLSYEAFLTEKDIKVRGKIKYTGSSSKEHYYSNSYRKSVDLIKYAPNIHFLPIRINSEK